MNKKTPRRKRLLISPRFQTLVAVHAVITTLLIVPIFFVVEFYFFNLFILKAQAAGLPPEHELIQFMDRQRSLMVVLLCIATLLGILINLICSYIFSNRIAGSMYRLTTSFNQTLDIAHAEPIQSRKWDFFSEVFEAYNRLLERSRS